MKDLERALQEMPEPEPRAEMAAVIGARIAQVDEERAQRRVASAGDPAAVAPAPRRLAWALSAAGMVVAVGAQAYLIAAGQAPLEPLSPRISGAQPPLQMLSVNPAVASMALGLALYLAGFLAPGPGGRRT